VKRRMSIILLVSLVMVCLILVGNVRAINQGTSPIDSIQVTQWTNGDPPFYTQLNANITSWLKWEILPTHTYEWEWITFDPAFIICNESGTVFIQFPPYITIASWNATLPYAPWNYSGGTGDYWLMIAMFGSNFGHLTITTNYISSTYWHTSIPINITLTAGTSVNSQNYTLNI